MLKALIALFVLAFASAYAYSPDALADKVASMPNAPADLKFDIFAGYLDIANNTKSIFYHMYTSETGYNNAPVVFTTSGGPGCDSIYFSFVETGAFVVKKDLSLSLRETRFNKLANVVYLSQPAGVGFSIDRTGSHTWTDKEAAKDFAEAMATFFVRFPEIEKNSVYLNSESYGGHYMPMTALEIVTNSYNFNFKGTLTGNPLVYMPHRDAGQYLTYIDNKLFPYPESKKYVANCIPSVTDAPNPPASRPSVCDTLEATFDEFLDLVDPYAVNYPICIGQGDGLLRNKVDTSSYALHTLNMFRKASGKPAFSAGKRFRETSPYIKRIIEKKSAQSPFEFDLQDISPAYDPCEENYTITYFNRPEVQAAFHVRSESNKKWSTCSNIRYSNYDMITTMVPVWEYLMKNTSLRLVIMSGDNDSMCSTTESLNMFENFLKPASDWKQHVGADGQLSGFKRTYTTDGAKVPLHFVTVRSGGHMVPTTNPTRAFGVYSEFINGTI